MEMDEIWFVETVESETDLRDDNCHHVQLSPCSQKEVRCERDFFCSGGGAIGDDFSPQQVAPCAVEVGSERPTIGVRPMPFYMRQLQLLTEDLLHEVVLLVCQGQQRSRCRLLGQ